MHNVHLVPLILSFKDINYFAIFVIYGRKSKEKQEKACQENTRQE